jgi:hypothetical protein
MEDNKSGFNKLKLKFYDMKRAAKIIIIILIIIISSLTFLILKNYIFKENASYLGEENNQVIDKEITAAELRKEIAEQQMKSSDLDLSEKIVTIEEIRDPFFPSQNRGKQNLAEEEALIYSENELKAVNEVNHKEFYKDENDIEAIYQEKSSREAEVSGLEDHNNSKDDEKAHPALQNESTKINLKRKIIEIEIPFSLLGIIKNKNTSAALLAYQGKVIKKSEGENIENFQIEKIKKEMIVLAYDDFKYNQYIWRHDEIEEN